MIRTAKECLFIFNDNIFNKHNTIQTFNKYFYGSFDIEIIDSKIVVHTDLPLNFEVSYNNSGEKKMIYAFLRYVLNTFDFSYTLSFGNIEDLRF
jgi:hypothetical protein